MNKKQYYTKLSYIIFFIIFILIIYYITNFKKINKNIGGYMLHYTGKLRNNLNLFPNNSFTLYNNFKYSSKLSIKDIKELKYGQKKMSNMLKEFDRICQKYNIRYFLIAGTLLGAVVYKGWIPWDGDVDLEVHEEDYPILLEHIEKELPNTMWFQTKDTDKHYVNSTIEAKLRDLNSCYVDKLNSIDRIIDAHLGLHVDINIYKEIDNKIEIPDNPTITYLTKDDIYPLKRVIFEDFYVNIMNNPKKYLYYNYGKNWNKILPINKRHPHEGRIDSKNTCKYHYEKYPNLYKKNKL